MPRRDICVVLSIVLFSLLTRYAFALYGPKSNVEILTSKNFKEKVLESDEPWLVEFFAPWCGHCKQLAPEYEKAATSLKGLVRIGAIDCDVDRDIGGEYGIKGFPTLKYFPPEGKPNPYRRKELMKTPEDYNEARKAKAIVDFMLDKLTAKYILQVTNKNIDVFLARMPVLPKVLLFTNKSPTTPLYKALSSQFKARLLFAEVKHTEKELISRYNIETFPTLIVVKSDSPTPIVFEGKLGHESLHKFLSSHAAAEPIPSDPDQPIPKKKSKGDKKHEPEVHATEEDTESAKALWSKAVDAQTQETFSTACNSQGGICIIALLPEDDRSKFFKILEEVAIKKSNGLFRFIAIDGYRQSKFVDFFRLASDFPQVLMASPKKARYLPYVGAFTVQDISEFVDRISTGTVRTIPFNAEELPSLEAAS